MSPVPCIPSFLAGPLANSSVFLGFCPSLTNSVVPLTYGRPGLLGGVVWLLRILGCYMLWCLSPHVLCATPHAWLLGAPHPVLCWPCLSDVQRTGRYVSLQDFVSLPEQN